MAGTPAAAAVLKQLRLAARLSQEQLAERCHVSERTIRTLESGTAKRPHRETLLALAGALELSPAATADFVSSWRRDHRLMHDLLAGRSPEATVRAELTALRSNNRELVVHQLVRTDRFGRWRSSTIRRIFQVTGHGVRRFPFLVSVEPGTVDPNAVHLTDVVNMRVGAEFLFGEAGAKAYIGEFDRELTIGESCAIEYTVVYEGAYRSARPGPEDDEALFALSTAVPVYVVEVHFDPAAVPARVWRVRLRSMDQAAERVEQLTVGPAGVVQAALAPAPSGVHGLQWDWDEDHCE